MGLMGGSSPLSRFQTLIHKIDMRIPSPRFIENRLRVRGPDRASVRECASDAGIAAAGEVRLGFFLQKVKSLSCNGRLYGRIGRRCGHQGFLLQKTWGLPCANDPSGF